MHLEEKTINALRWIVDILDKHKINYQISGGFAGKIFGCKRELNDIDIDISKKDFDKILPEISTYIIYGPSHYIDAKWDLELITLNYHGQEIDIGDCDNILISNKERTKWISFATNFSKTLDINLNGIKIKVINPKDFIEYKKELDGEHQLEDIEAAKCYLIKNNH
ncbi:hypothetical protein A2356_03490 [Candidatus Nomurabacteria bacterium RIFOXYB1_FULL_39_16]|uniref:MazG-related protein n=2 Tax=Candidatus Nomuraibacteriota TaxID=1752729 RepID=A0A0G0QTX3_9BACT|nr:MAG: hypothetical protein UT78_C0001G0115 [Candidatus Nomurabacteria bacterium GW2011_GWF2_40_12]OGJ08857.1 MAG: hypothetical protein A2356_03490 [Candidatus Nomurabacteria bacterium RIFOXYB1_FULL_39_16]OGJ14926.1 MAG: hypothetical protein A2585_03440 [Candidatus Nomurabacteria bacterium RIFOXYD1_FULL_39_12]